MKPELIVTLNKGDPVPETGSLAIPMEPFAAGFDRPFSVSDWKKLRQTTARRNQKLYVMFPGFVLEDQLEELTQLVAEIQDADGLYYGDEAVFMAAAQAGFGGTLIFQPDTLICSSADANAVRSMGADCVSLAHELSLEEVCRIAAHADGLEVQVQGYYPVLTSRRKLLSAYGEETRNMEIHEGLYQLQESTRDSFLPILEQKSGTVLFTPVPVQSLRQIPALLEAGISRFRLDSRFMDPEIRNLAIAACQAVLNGQDWRPVLDGKHLPGSDDIWGKETVKTKEETL